jgi:aminopeptidase YwaD
MRMTPALLIAVLATTAASAQSTTQSRTRTHVQTLASAKFEGRMAGSTGERLAAEYIARELARVGAKPLPGAKDMYQAF